MNDVWGVIPARMGSTRFPGKVLADLCGKPVIQHVYERACQSKLLGGVLVACDDERIRAAVASFGGRSVLTRSDHPSGTDRIAEAVRELECSRVVNIQADEPLIRPEMIDALIEGLDDGCEMSTLARPMSGTEGYSDPNIVKVVFDRQANALYFSRSPIPYERDTAPGGAKQVRWFRHVGLYGYRRDFLLYITSCKPTSLELSERLEQLRVLEMGGRIRVVLTHVDSVGVDTPGDLEEVKKRL